MILFCREEPWVVKGLLKKYIASYTSAKSMKKVQMRREGKSSVINSAVSRLLRYEHCGNGHEAEVAVSVGQSGPYIRI